MQAEKSSLLFTLLISAPSHAEERAAIIPGANIAPSYSYVSENEGIVPESEAILKEELTTTRQTSLFSTRSEENTDRDAPQVGPGSKQFKTPCHFIVSYTKRCERSVQTYKTQPLNQAGLQRFIQQAAGNILITQITRTMPIHPVVDKPLTLPLFSAQTTDALQSASSLLDTPSMPSNGRPLKSQDLTQATLPSRSYLGQLVNWATGLFAPLPEY
ncbi:hypothetical protein [Candidatus Odyssella thessalonicensis]|uniref:hypothetical protein n=1 Tax=Candidatus Odyssella thessalonicensis TaxID=84647 RepID=UPI000225AC4A|nr:hypothetical protein [Candidatus Odyssella thessalonicensis]